MYLLITNALGKYVNKYYNVILLIVLKIYSFLLQNKIKYLVHYFL